MRYLRRSAFLRLFVLPFTLTVWLSACMSYATMKSPVEHSIDQEEPDHIRVTLNDDSRFVVAEPRIVADSLVGFDNKSWDRERRVYTQSVRLALKDVSIVERKESNTLVTAGLAMLGALTLGALIYGATNEGLP